MSDMIDRAAVQSAVRAYLALEDTDAALEVERIIAALPAVSAPVAVRVKPLEWEPHWTGGKEAREFAKTPIGLEYHVNDSGWWFPMDELRICADRAKAKAAAQADYAARIMAAIDAPDVAELVEAAGELADAFVKQIGDRKHSAWPVIRRVRAALARIGGQ